MAFNVLTYGSLTLDSTEILRVNFSHGVSIGEQPTLSGYDLTQTGSIKPLRITVEMKLRGDLTVTIIDWVNALESRAIQSLDLIGILWGDFYLESLDVTSTGLDNSAGTIFMDMTVSFVRSVTL